LTRTGERGVEGGRGVRRGEGGEREGTLTEDIDDDFALKRTEKGACTGNGLG